MRTFKQLLVVIMAMFGTCEVLAQVPLTESFQDQVTSAPLLDNLDAEITLNEGILQYELGNYQGALQCFEPLSATHSVAAQYCDLCYQQISDSHPDSGQGYQSVMTGPPRENGLDASQPKNRRWNLTLLTGYQYDSNVSLSPNFVGLGAITDKSDSSWYFASFGEFRLIEEADRNLGIIASVYRNYFFQQTAFDLQDYMGGVYVNQVFGPNMFGGVRYEYHTTRLDDSAFSGEHRIVPNVSLIHGDRGHTTVYYEFDALRFHDEPLIPALDPSAYINAVGVTRAWYTCCGQGRIYAGYRFENASAEGSDFDRNTSQVNVRIEAPINDGLIVDAGVRYFWDEYDNPNSLDFFGNPRSDERLEFRTGIQRILNRHLSARVDYRYINSDSNVANLFDVRFYDYSTHNLTAQIIYDF